MGGAGEAGQRLDPAPSPGTFEQFSRLRFHPVHPADLGLIAPLEDILSAPHLSQPAYLLLEDGRRFNGHALGALDVALGEVVFNTSMTGYQEILTDPSYTGQLVVMTSPQQGNYGLNSQDGESQGPCAAGFVVREAARVYSSWRGEEGLEGYLLRHGIPGIQGVDTRALTRHIRSHGAMRGGLAPGDVDQEELMNRIQAHPRMEGLDLACGVSTGERYEYAPQGEERFHVVAHDFGVKTHSPLILSQLGCRVTVVPATASAEEVMQLRPDGYFLSNGPGDPAAVDRVSDTILTVARSGTPVFGICLGHQLISRAFGASTYKLPFGHHGGNHPVRNLDRGTVEITSQNHGFAVTANPDGSVPGAPDLRVTHVNLYDGTVEGVAHRSLPIQAVQFHPEAAPGPHDSRYLFQDFLDAMERRTHPVGA